MERSPPTVRVGPEPIDPGAELGDFCTGRDASGAVVSFTGLVRGGADTTLELQHYPGYTEARLREHAGAVAARFGLDDLLVVHRVGRIGPGEAVVFVAAAARHRRAAFEGADAAMDWLKSAAPFWKRETDAAGARWIEPRPEDHADLARWEEGDPPQSEVVRRGGTA